MRFLEYLQTLAEDCVDCEIVFIDEDHEIVTEGDMYSDLADLQDLYKQVSKKMSSEDRTKYNKLVKTFDHAVSEKDFGDAAKMVDSIEHILIKYEDLHEGVKRAFKRRGKNIKRMYRCTSGPKKGKVVSDPKVCVQRKDPVRKRIGKKVAREKKGIRIRKSKVTNKTARSKLVRRLNLR